MYYKFIRLISAIFLLTAVLSAQMISEDWQFPEARQFDFWIGEWKVNNRFKQDNNSWKDQGGAEVKIYSVLDGKAVMEFWNGTGRDFKETKGFSLRYYDPEIEKWRLALNWPQPNYGGIFFLEGEFRHYRGEFFSERNTPDGEQIINRYTFCDITDSTLRWNDGVSLDSGKTWETNWIMEFSRTGSAPGWPSADEHFHTYENDSWNTTEEGKRFEELVGSWSGKAEITGPKGDITKKIFMDVWKVQNGASLLMRINSTGEKVYKEIMMLTYREMNDVWLLLGLDNRKDTGFNLFFWKVNDEKPKFKKASRNSDEEVIMTWEKFTGDEIILSQVDKTYRVNLTLTLSKEN